MKEAQNEFFDKIEDFIDNKEKSTFLNDLERDQGLKDELKFRLNIQENWNKASRFEKIKKQTQQITMKKNQTYQFARYFSYAAAACLLFFISAPAYKYFTNQNRNTLEIEQSEIKSTVSFFDTRYRQISPVNGQIIGEKSILFQWETSLDVKTSFVIKNLETGEIVFSQFLDSDIKNLRIVEKLAKGKYVWRLEGFKGEMVFFVN